MLILNRNIGEKVILRDDIVVMVLNVSGNQVKIGFIAPHEISIHREEIYQRIKNQTVGQNKIY